MSTAILRKLSLQPPAGVYIAETAGELAAIHDPGCAAAIWQRPMQPAFRSWINSLPPGNLPKARVVLRPDAVHRTVAQICNSHGTPDGPERAQLVDDIAALADIFASVMQARYLRLRLDAVTTNACRKFHVDAVTARLVCTYRGTGTQYGTGRRDADPEQIHTVPTGAPVLLRGTQWPEQPHAGLLHRSPPIEGSGETRLLLVLDPVSDPADLY